MGKSIRIHLADGTVAGIRIHMANPTIYQPNRRHVLSLAGSACLAACLPTASIAQAIVGNPAAAPAGGSSASAPARRFTHFRVGSKNVKRILVERGPRGGDIVWVGTSGGLVRYDLQADDYKLYDHRSGLLSNGIFHVGRINGRLALGTYGGGLALLDEETQRWKTYNIPEGLGDAFVYDCLTARKGDLWIATWSGVNRIRGGAIDDRRAWELHTVASTDGPKGGSMGLPNDWVYGLDEGLGGDIWLATEGGVCLYREDETRRPAGGKRSGPWQNWNHAAGLGADYNKVKGQIQFRSDPGQASEHHARQKQEMGLTDVDVAYNPNYVVSLAVDAAGVVWAGTWGGGLSRFDGQAWRHFTVADGLPGNHVFMLQIDRSGQLWIGTNQGLARPKAGGGYEVLTTHDGLYGDAVFALADAPDGSLWVGSYGGVSRLAPP
jgi:ligand-binding sensor domain-containing protein